MIVEKGVSGNQTTVTGCLLILHPRGMADLITEVLAGLMENDISKMWEFDQFFKQIERIHRKKIVDVFCVSTCTCHKIFIDPDEQNG